MTQVILNTSYTYQIQFLDTWGYLTGIADRYRRIADRIHGDTFLSPISDNYKAYILIWRFGLQFAIQ